MPPAGFVPAIATNERRPTNALDRAVTGIGKKTEVLVEKNLPHCHFTHHKFRIDWPGIEPELPQRCRQLTA